MSDFDLTLRDIYTAIHFVQACPHMYPPPDPIVAIRLQYETWRRFCMTEPKPLGVELRYDGLYIFGFRTVPPDLSDSVYGQYECLVLRGDIERYIFTHGK